ncbi:MAG: NUDIX domain-containing protein [Chloroflexi bacterium]|nr:NUDIX domain-containing protein [Chloroflexota bacterium]
MDLDRYASQSEAEAHDVARLRQLLAGAADPWARAAPLHLTGSAVVVHPPTGRVLLRWHDRMQAWLQVGGHADPGETDAFLIAAREAREETGLTDLVPWPDAERPRIIQVAVVPVPAAKGEPEHEHGDIRYALATDHPDAIAPESDSAQLEWLDVDEAIAKVGWDNLRICLTRLADLLRQRV